MLKKTIAMLAAAVLTTGLTACSQTKDDAADKPQAEVNTERVVVLNTGQLENMLELGIVPVGTALAKGSKGIPQFVRDAYGGMGDLDAIKTVGGRDNPDIEAIAALKPTLICANERMDESIRAQLAQIAPLALGKGGGENWKNDFLTIAEAVNKKDEAEKKLNTFEEKAKQLAGKWGNPAPTVNFLRTKGDAYEIFGAKSFAGTIAEAAQLQRPESGQFIDKAGHPVSAEQLASADADYLFYGVAVGGTNPSTTPVWQTLSVVQRGHAVPVDYEAWYTNASYLAAMNMLDGFEKHIIG